MKGQAWRLTAVATALVSTGLMHSGCNLIVGAGDYSVGTSDASTAPDGSTASAGRIGDMCSVASDCKTGTCQGQWCTQPCNSNAECGNNSALQPNYCVQNGSGELVCVPGCTMDSDCSSFAGASCQPIAGVAESVCATTSSTVVDAGGTIGDPCTSNSDCGMGTCMGEWCSQSCSSSTDTSCGTNGVGQTNFCIENADKTFICFPGCTTNTDCTPYSGTTCQAAVNGPSGEFICSLTNGLAGDPCSSTNPNEWTACTSPASCNGAWCTKPCASASDTSCGSSSAGQSNYCVENAQSSFICFPGCATNADCAPYTDTFCEQIIGGSNFICSKSGGLLGDPCSMDSDCTQGNCGAGNWCTQSCSGAGATCGTSTAGQTNSCVQNSATNAFECFPGCKADTDCTPFSGATCQTLTGGQSVCSY